MYDIIYIIINVTLRCVWVRFGRIWACDSSLEPSCPKNDHVINLFWFACAARSQYVKMYFLLHKTLNGRFEACIANMYCI